MKPRYLILLSIFLMLLCTKIQAGKILYKVQIGTYHKDEAPKELSNLPNVNTVYLPEGNYTYFYGGFYENYLGCKLRLSTLKK